MEEMWAELVIAIGTLALIAWRFISSEKKSSSKIEELADKVSNFEQITYEYKIRLAVLEDKHPELKKELSELRDKFEKIREVLLKYFTEK